MMMITCWILWIPVSPDCPPPWPGSAGDDEPEPGVPGPGVPEPGAADVDDDPGTVPAGLPSRLPAAPGSDLPAPTMCIWRGPVQAAASRPARTTLTARSDRGRRRARLAQVTGSSPALPRA